MIQMNRNNSRSRSRTKGNLSFFIRKIGYIYFIVMKLSTKERKKQFKTEREYHSIPNTMSTDYYYDDKRIWFSRIIHSNYTLFCSSLKTITITISKRNWFICISNSWYFLLLFFIHISFHFILSNHFPNKVTTITITSNSFGLVVSLLLLLFRSIKIDPSNDFGYQSILFSLQHCSWGSISSTRYTITITMILSPYIFPIPAMISVLHQQFSSQFDSSSQSWTTNNNSHRDIHSRE